MKKKKVTVDMSTLMKRQNDLVNRMIVQPNVLTLLDLAKTRGNSSRYLKRLMKKLNSQNEILASMPFYSARPAAWRWYE